MDKKEGVVESNWLRASKLCPILSGVLLPLTTSLGRCVSSGVAGGEGATDWRGGHHSQSPPASH